VRAAQQEPRSARSVSFATSYLQKNYGDIGRDAVRESAIRDALAAVRAAVGKRRAGGPPSHCDGPAG
jgi:hypothetical protein